VSKEIPLSKGQVAIVDDDDFERVNQYNWHVLFSRSSGVFYASTKWTINHKRVYVSLHSFILNFPKGKQIDHINHDPLDNRKCNLRLCTNQQNSFNKGPREYMDGRVKTSLYKGVSWKKRNKKWCAQIMVDGKKKHIGLYKEEKEAAKAYNEFAKRLFGDFAYLNENID
jgi:hypothetical protein